jgi:SAM-dependent methyltransferase
VTHCVGEPHSSHSANLKPIGGFESTGSSLVTRSALDAAALQQATSIACGRRFMDNSLYSDTYYGRHKAGMQRSAHEVVPLVMNLVAPASVVDVGCGEGIWLAEFLGAGVTRVFGIDGPWVSPEQLAIPKEAFRAVDLEQPGPAEPLGRFDLCISLEVAEHLPRRSASAFVHLLVTLAPAVLFSAATPEQGGKGHINEQWPIYWAQLFSKHDFVRLDPFRHILWHKHNVQWWYRQNMFLYVARHLVQTEPKYSEAYQLTHDSGMMLLHEDVLYRMSSARGSLTRLRRIAVTRLLHSLGRALSRMLSFPRSWLRYLLTQQHE